MKLAILPLICVAAASISCEAQQPAAPTVKAEAGKPASVDGIEITFSNPRVGKLPKAPARNGVSYSVPDTDFLIVDVALKNATPAKIINLSWIWNETNLKDEHGNFYKAQDLTSAFGVAGRIEGRIKPGQEMKGIVAFEVPLENAKEITLISDPGFFRDSDDGLIYQISKDRVSFEFKNPAAKP